MEEIKITLDSIKLKEYAKIHNDLMGEIDKMDEKHIGLILNLLKRIHNLDKNQENLDSLSDRLKNLKKSKEWFVKKAVYHPYLV